MARKCRCAAGCSGGGAWNLERFYSIQREADDLAKQLATAQLLRQNSQQLQQLHRGMKSLQASLGVGEPLVVGYKSLDSDDDLAGLLHALRQRGEALEDLTAEVNAIGTEAQIDKLEKSLQTERAEVCARVCELDPDSGECQACRAPFSPHHVKTLNAISTSQQHLEKVRRGDARWDDLQWSDVFDEDY